VSQERWRDLRSWRIQGENAKLAQMDKGRKRVLLIAASILAARKLADWDGRPSPAFESTIANAISTAERIMEEKLIGVTR
jgi:hypothetical protein